MSNAPATCRFCDTPLAVADGPRKGRPQEYCNAVCRQAAHRERRKAKTRPPTRTDAPAPSPPPTLSAAHPPGAPARADAPSMEDTLMEIVKDMQEELRQLARCLSATETPPEDALRRAVRMRAQLEGLTAGLVGLARDRRLTWSAIGDLLGIGEDTARHRFQPAYIARRLGQLVRFRQEAPAKPKSRRSHTEPAKTPPPTTDAAAAEPSRASYNRLAPVLSMLARSCDLPLQTIAKRTGCSPSYLSRLLSGERVPTWTMTERFAKACGADPLILRKVWESERLKEKEPALRRAAEPGTSPVPGVDDLLAALRTLHVRAGRPTAYDVAVASRWKLTPDRVSEILDGAVEDWDDLAVLLYVLGGDRDYFRPLWEAAEAAASRIQPPAAPAAVEPALPPSGEVISQRVPGLLERFSGVLGSRPHLSPRQERVLKAKRDAVLANRLDGHTALPIPDDEPQ
ncbi:helix-turn-helix domain-containing protein [Kitasatospora sp. NPDC048194]|uniref:helix-turn-helix domain-containing protein n=1 Tax=Kitasatospora sp. NPDC048194 TaxID=3364045 RepID=UPI0037127A63